MSVLEVPGAHLYYETHGSGPIMIMVPGAAGVADGFRKVTEHLAAHYTVVLYDRRGFPAAGSTGRRTTSADCRPPPMTSAA